MENTTLNTIRQHIIENEGQPQHSYLDIKGNLTIGTGFKIETEKEFLSLPLVNRGTSKPATQDEKKAEYLNMQGLREQQVGEPEKYNKIAEDYWDDTKLDMPELEQNKRLDVEISTRVDDIRGDVGADVWDGLSTGQKTVAVDVHYANGSLDKFPAYKKAMQDGDAQAMARESTFYTDKENDKRDVGRLVRNRVAVTGEDEVTARSKLEEQFRERKVAMQADSGKQDLTDEEKPKPARRPEIQGFLQDLKTPNDPISAILLKSPAEWTEEEVNQVHGSDAYQSASSLSRNEATAKVREWYDLHYGDGPVQTDDTGKTMQPVFTTVPKSEPAAAKDNNGQPLLDEIMAAGEKIAELADKREFPTAIKGAQIGLNLLDKFKSDGSQKSMQLKTDGLFGPKTKQSFENAIAALGRPRIENALAMGSFQNLLEGKGANVRENLAEAAHDSFSNLFENTSKFKAGDKSPKPWGMVLQDTINDVGSATFGRDAFKPLKDDGWIGPKTSSAFQKIFKPTGMSGFMKSLGSNFGFI